MPKTIKYILLFFVLIFSQDGYAMDGFSDDEVKTTGKKELSECGKAIASFRKFMVLARNCKRDTDCTVIEGMCPLGCKFYVSNQFAALVESRKEEISKICTGQVCNECPDTVLTPVCNKNKCEGAK